MSRIDIGESLAAANRQNAEGAVKTTEDLARYRAILEATRPDLIVECGTFNGGSAAWFQQFAPVLTIDVDDGNLLERFTENWHGRVTMLLGSTTAPEIIARVRDVARQSRCLVSLDSDHSAHHVYVEIMAYSALVPVGGYLVVEDTLLRWMDHEPASDGGPLDAVEKFLTGTDAWINDVDIEGMFTQTQHVGGWLRRLR